MTGLADKRVAVIGTGATAVQCVPRLAREAGELFVFQRTPSSVDVRANHPIDPDRIARIAKPGSQQRWVANLMLKQQGGLVAEDMGLECWTDRDRSWSGGPPSLQGP